MTEKAHAPITEETTDHLPEVSSGIFGNFSTRVTTQYEKLLEQEAMPADPDEVIHLGTLEADSPERAQLLRAGIPSSAIDDGNVSRKELIDAGFAFLNKIGGGEKALIATTVKMSDGSAADTRQRTLLTTAELDAIKQSQGPSDPTANEHTRIMMIDFLQASKEVASMETEIKKVLFKEAQRRVLDSGNEENIALLGKFFQSIAKSGDNYRIGFVIDHCAANLGITRIGGIPISVFSSRSGILRGEPSPFLDSGYHFDVNDDVTIYPEDPTKTRRLNSVVVHLLSRGIHEEGASTNGSHDQTYITDKEFLKLVETFDESDVDLYDNEMIETFTTRLLENVKELNA